MPKYIEAEAFLRNTIYNTKHVPYITESDVAEAPAADVRENVHAHWVKVGQSFLNPNRFRNFACSRCGFDIEQKKFRFCPNCGAEMAREA